MTLETHGLSFGYRRGKGTVLEGVDLTLHAGERLGLTAPSGRGKTTLCKLLAGYERPETGEVLLDGKPLGSYTGYCPVQMVWQHPELALNPRMRMGEALKEGGSIPDRLLEGLGIQEEWKKRYPSELSGGELQRFCLARALGTKTRFLLADEISAMLDLVTQAQIWGFLLQEAQERGIGILAVSHSMPLLERVCTRIIKRL